MSIKVAVRVRPFNQREKQMNTDLCIRMDNKTTVVLDDDGETTRKSFTLDHCFWSHDGYKEEPNGYLLPASTSSGYHDQQFVYNVLGRDILKNAMEGYHCCLFAYGQTGSGKSYSIFGYGENKGVVPLICNELLNGKTLVNDEKRSFVLSVSMLEIYNEKIQDLLIPIAKRPKSGLRVRENPKIGVFVENLSKYEVSTYKEIEGIIEEGSKNKTLASTLMNATSSRAHTIITLELIQKEKALKKTTQKTSVINLVDLAGSEKVSKTGAKADRLKEACSINKSLSVLGIVIHQLFKKSTGQKTIVSYRDSVLTYILKNALGGNSKTTMICSISPARDNIDETISTLRYADQAKRIKLHAVVNESETDKLIKDLTAENEKLKALLAQLQAGGNLQNITDIQDQIKEVSHAIHAQNIFSQPKSMQRRNSFTPNMKIPDEIELHTCPHMLNLNEDPLLNGKIFYNFKETPIIGIGRETGNDLAVISEEEDQVTKKIVLNGVGVIENHARITYNDKGVFITVNDRAAASNTFINGEIMEIFENENGKGYSRQLEDLDRIIIGTSSTFLIRIPDKGKEVEKAEIDGKNVDWEYCQTEKMKNQQKLENEKMKQFYEEKDNELKEKEALLRKNFDQEKNLIEKRVKDQEMIHKKEMEKLQKSIKQKQMEQMEANLNKEDQMRVEAERQIELELKQKELEYQRRVANIHKERQQFAKMKAISENIEKKLINYYPKIHEANMTAETLKRNIQFVPFAASLNLFSVAGGSNTSADLIINVKVINYEDGWTNYWDLEKFENRLQLMKEEVEYFFSNNELKYLKGQDPFWDPKEYVLHGQGICIMKNILYRFQMEHKMGILGYEGDIGQAYVRLMPVDDEGKPIDEEEEEEEIEEPTDLITLEKPCHFRIEIDNISFYDKDRMMNKSFHISYDVLTSKGPETFKTPNYVVKGAMIDLHYSQLVSIPIVDEDIISHYLNNNLVLRLLIDDKDDVEKKGKLPPPIVNNKGMNTSNVYATYYQSTKFEPNSSKNSQINEKIKKQQKRRKTEMKPSDPSKRNQSTVCTIF